MLMEDHLQSEVNGIINEHWDFLNKNYVTIVRKYKHMTELQELKAKHIIKKSKTNYYQS